MKTILVCLTIAAALCSCDHTSGEGKDKDQNNTENSAPCRGKFLY